jgi:hypothetical protein
MVLGIDPLRRRLGWPDPVPIACVAFAGCVLLALVRRVGTSTFRAAPGS